MIRTETGLYNLPGLVEILNLACLCSAVLEPLRELTGPLDPTSGYRSPVVNREVDGASNSDHLRGEAVDFIATRIDRITAWGHVVFLAEAGLLPIHQGMVYETKGHIHVSHRRLAQPARRQLLVELAEPHAGKRTMEWTAYQRAGRRLPTL